MKVGIGDDCGAMRGLTAMIVNQSFRDEMQPVTDRLALALVLVLATATLIE